MAAEDARVDVPPTLKALLATRLDQLDGRAPRARARLCGRRDVRRGGVQALAPDEREVTNRPALVRRQLVRPDRAQIAGDDGYRFCHLLIRDAAYDALPKAVRADLHARFADWLNGTVGHSSSVTKSSATTSSRPPVTWASSRSQMRTLRNAPRCDSPLPADVRVTAWITGLLLRF